MARRSAIAGCLSAFLCPGLARASDYGSDNGVILGDLLAEVPLAATTTGAATCAADPSMFCADFPTSAMAYHAPSGRVAVANGATYWAFDVNSFSFSPAFTSSVPAPVTAMMAAGPWMAMGATDGVVYLVDITVDGAGAPITLATAEVASTGRRGPVTSVAVCPSETSGQPTRVAAAGETVRLWDVADDGSDQLVDDFAQPDGLPVKAMICFSWQSNLYLAVATGLRIGLWSWPQGGGGSIDPASPVFTLDRHLRAVTALAWLPVLQKLASGDDEGQVAYWELENAIASPNPSATVFFQADPDSITSLAGAVQPGGQEALATGGRGGMVRLWEDLSTEPQCGFVRHVRKYLDGYNRETHLNTELSDCLRRCCNADWCKSLDYQHTEVEDSESGSGRCLLADTNEALSGQGLTNDKAFDHYVVARRSGILQELRFQHKDPVAGLAAFVPGKLITMARGELRLWRTGFQTCPDGSSPDDGRRFCQPCKMGTAGTAGSCDSCPPGQYADAEGSFTCQYCDPGSYSPYYGLAGCYLCPIWSLIGGSGMTSCLWCDPGEMPSQDRYKCVAFERGVEWQPSAATRSVGGTAAVWRSGLGLTCMIAFVVFG